MHVISSDADVATNKAFGLGQWLGVNLTWQQATLTREFDGRAVQFEEPIWTRSPSAISSRSRPGSSIIPTRPTADGTTVLLGQEVACIDPGRQGQHIPVEHNEPLAFIQTDENFIADHNDVFNDKCRPTAAIVARPGTSESDGSVVLDPRLPQECRSDEFETCFDYYQEQFKERGLTAMSSGGSRDRLRPCGVGVGKRPALAAQGRQCAAAGQA